MDNITKNMECQLSLISEASNFCMDGFNDKSLFSSGLS